MRSLDKRRRSYSTSGQGSDVRPKGEFERLWVHQILTINGLVGEINDTHHPVGGFLYYEDQKPDASRRSQGFRTKRIPKDLDRFENILERNPKGSAYLVGDSVS